MDRELVKCPGLFHLRKTPSFGSTAALTALAIQLLSIHCVLCQAPQDKKWSLTIVKCAGNLGQSLLLLQELTLRWTIMLNRLEIEEKIS
ncbi:MAG: hypothetical protein ATN32_08590 [Candidatus Epulonipiscium fishelsonii]|nr:MAG: hypothetical protein ATN32_08590 [Epulopiscium sp. AS2M-Bin002]